MFSNTNPRKFARAPGQPYPVNARPETRQDALPSSRTLTLAASDGHLPNLHQPHQSTPYQRAYQATADNEEVGSKPPPEEVLEVLYGGQELDKDGRYYTDQADDEVFVGFLGIESLCQRCGQGFPSRSTLHKDLKAKCVPVQDSLNATSPAQQSSPIPVLQSKATFEAGSSGFAFRGWSYATAAVTLVPSAIPDHATPDESCCLDTGCGVTLVDRSWLTQRLPNQKISKMAVPLKVRGIGSAKHDSDEFVSVLLYFLGRDKSK